MFYFFFSCTLLLLRWSVVRVSLCRCLSSFSLFSYTFGKIPPECPWNFLTVDFFKDVFKRFQFFNSSTNLFYLHLFIVFLFFSHYFHYCYYYLFIIIFIIVCNVINLLICFGNNCFAKHLFLVLSSFHKIFKLSVKSSVL